MTNINYKSDHGVSHQLYILKNILILFFFVFITGCSLQVHKRDLIQNVLNQENSLIEKLEAERNDPAIVSKARQDKSLLQAEIHLREAINALKAANAVVRETF